MDIRKLSDGLAVSPQITAADMAGDMAEIAGAGFHGAICNRPDGGGADQPAHEASTQSSLRTVFRKEERPVGRS